MSLMEQIEEFYQVCNEQKEEVEENIDYAFWSGAVFALRTIDVMARAEQVSKT